MLNDDQRRFLLSIARLSVVHEVTGTVLRLSEDPDLPPASGVFVTLKNRGELRGCLGTLECRASLTREVVRCAADAASRDPRFPPVAREELVQVAIEISVLGPLEQIDPARQGSFAIGLHGLLVEQGRRRGLLLPQVAIEWSWTPVQFLSQTCLKAGLSSRAWQEGAAVYRFDAEVFGE